MPGVDKVRHAELVQYPHHLPPALEKNARLNLCDLPTLSMRIKELMRKSTSQRREAGRTTEGKDRRTVQVYHKDAAETLHLLSLFYLLPTKT